MRGHLVASSAVPTPGQIAPYREALVVNEYEVPDRRRKKIGADRVRVAHWAVLDGRVQPVPSPAEEVSVLLQLEPWERHPRLESTYLADTLGVNPEIPLYVDVGP
jgi:hypothetical protein